MTAEPGARSDSDGTGADGDEALETGALDLSEIRGPFDLQSTLESGQSYLWDRPDGRMYESIDAHGGDAWYRTVVPPIDGVTDEDLVVRVRQRDGALEWAATGDPVPALEHLLRLDDDLAAIYASAPDDDIFARAFDDYRGMRLVRDPPFPCLVSFICSAQMRVSRIHGMQMALSEAFGTPHGFAGESISAFPTPEQLAARGEDDLRELKLGYRAPYVQQTAEMIADGEANPTEAVGLSYEDARESLTRFVGVGDKVADCVLLFSLGYLEAVPLDTWIRGAIADHFPECDRGNYTETSRALRERLGGEYAGYVQTYLFHYLRAGGEA
ncbi:DNA-3-methyladenine glycosylase family protein [Halobellus captivus]|uniref:DNA-3-methyladenine glycosylase family protein n=1 Tax=Halobellus captivus TaxID=2592614 RepID=UPI00119FC63B|nr:DNA-3-methyladenine glycosylase [Halobellus captivus]